MSVGFLNVNPITVDCATACGMIFRTFLKFARSCEFSANYNQELLTI